MEELNLVTIIAKNYLAQARVLAHSFKKYNPNGKVFVLFADDIDNYFDPTIEDFITIEFDDLREQIDNLEGFCFKYSILELCTAFKPFVLKYIFEKYNLTKLAYFDPDILVTNSLQPLAELLEHNNIILTPHITQPYQDEKNPTEIGIMQAGIYNLGFIALANTSTSISMLDWWSKRLYNYCLCSMEKGLFVDQKWIDLVPCFFQGTYILQDPAYNVAYWNLHERMIEIKAEKFTVNNTALRFFHFSGFDPNCPNIISKYQDRHILSSIGDAAELFSCYANLLFENGYQEYRQLPYSFSTFDNGIFIAEIIRKIYRNLPNPKDFGNPFDTTQPNNFLQFLITEKENLIPLLTEIYNSRVDLQIILPDVVGKDKNNFISWIFKEGYIQFNLDRQLLNYIEPLLQNQNCDQLHSEALEEFCKEPIDSRLEKAEELELNSQNNLNTLQQLNQIKDLTKKVDNLDINKIAWVSNKPLIGFILKFYKRFVYKSIFWLLNPILVQLREVQHSSLHLQEQKMTQINTISNELTQLHEEIILLKEINKKLQHKIYQKENEEKCGF